MRYHETHQHARRGHDHGRGRDYTGDERGHRRRNRDPSLSHSRSRRMKTRRTL